MSFLLTDEAILSHINQDCNRGHQHHACKDIFKANPKLVKNWRALWASLPREARNHHLIDAVHNDGAFYFLGVRVCALAFQQLTGISAGALQKARDSRQAVSKQLLWLCISSTSKPKLYLATELTFGCQLSRVYVMPDFALLSVDVCSQNLCDSKRI